MPQLKINKSEPFTVRRAELNASTDASDMSPLGRKLMKIAAEIDRSNETAIGEDEIEKELEKRRGGYVRNGQ